jgi:ankyrin repeat protein
MIAAENGHTNLVELLLSRGADPSLRDHEGKTAHDLAAASPQ